MGVRPKRNPVQWTEQFMQQRLHNFRSNPRYVLQNLYVFGWESDLLFLSKSGIWTEIEIKISRSDFHADLKTKKDKHAVLADKTVTVKPNRFYYAVPEGLVNPDEVPEYAGLLWVNDWGSIPARHWQAPLLHKHKITPEQLELADKFYYNMVNAQRQALDAKLMADKCCGGYDQGFNESRQQTIQAAMSVFPLYCPHMQTADNGRIQCRQLGITRYNPCSQGLCDWMADIEDRLWQACKNL